MPLQLSEKEVVVTEMTERLKRATAVVVADYRGLTVAELRDLRSSLRKKGSEVQVIKNTLMRRACSEAGITPPTDLLRGPTAVVLLYDDLSSPTKTLLDFAKAHEVFALRGGSSRARPSTPPASRPWPTCRPAKSSGPGSCQSSRRRSASSSRSWPRRCAGWPRSSRPTPTRKATPRPRDARPGGTPGRAAPRAETMHLTRVLAPAHPQPPNR